MGGGSGPSTNPTRLVPFQQQEGTTIKPCLSVELGIDDIIRLAQNPNDIQANFNPIMVNRTGEGYMVVFERISDVAEDEQEIYILTVSTASPYKGMYETNVGTSPYFRIQKGTLRNTYSMENNLKGFYNFQFKTPPGVTQKVEQRKIDDGTFPYSYDLTGDTTYYLDFFAAAASFIFTSEKSTVKSAAQSGRVMSLDAVDTTESNEALASVIGGSSITADVLNMWKTYPIEFTYAYPAIPKKQCVMDKFMDARADPRMAFYKGDKYGDNTKANTFEYSEDITKFPGSDSGIWPRKDASKNVSISYQVDARESVTTPEKDIMNIKTNYPKTGFYKTQTATLIGATTLDEKICGGTVITAVDFVQYQKDGDLVVPVKNKNQVVFSISTIAMSGGGELSCQTGDGIKFTWDENGLTVDLPENDN